MYAIVFVVVVVVVAVFLYFNEVGSLYFIIIMDVCVCVYESAILAGTGIKKFTKTKEESNLKNNETNN